MRGNLKKNLGLQMFYRILVIITPLITSPIISRALGADKIGVYSATQAFANYFMLFAMLGVEYYGQRSIAGTSNREDRTIVFWEIYTVQFWASFVSIVIYYLSICLSNSSRAIIMTIQGVWVISCLFDINWFYFGVEDFKLIVTRNCIVKTITVICIVIFIRKPSDLYFYALIMAISTALSQMVLWKRIGKYVDIKHVKLTQCKKHFVPIIRLFIPMIALSIYHYMDKTMLDVLSNETEVGYYYAADKIIYVPLGLITAIGTVMLPRISSIVKESKENVEKLLNKSAELSACLASAVAFGIAAIAKEFVPFFFGEGYEKCSLILLFFVPVVFIKALSNIVNQQYLIPSKCDNQYTISVTGGAIVNLICNLMLIPKLGAIGATVGTLMAEFGVLSISIYLSKRKINFVKMFKKYNYYLVFGFIMFIAVRIYTTYVNISNIFIYILSMIVIGACVYGVQCLIAWITLKNKSLFGNLIISYYQKWRGINE